MLTLGLILSILISADQPALPATSFLTISVVDPKTQGDRFLALFEGAKAPHPAAALAGYRRAHNGVSGLSKAAEAGIASLNPRMFAELPLLNYTTVEFKRRADGRFGWNAVIPNDDGSFAALGPAFALTDGQSLPSIDGSTVDRLGPPGAPLMAKRDRMLVVGGTVSDIAEGLARETVLPAKFPSGIGLHLVPSEIGNPNSSLASRRIDEALVAAGFKYIDATIGLEADTLRVSCRGELTAPLAAKAKIEPSWLALPAGSKPLAAFAFAIDPSPQAWEALFAIIDRVEKVDPTHANVAPARVRLSLLLSAAKVRPETDLYPILKGVSGFILGDKPSKLDEVVVKFHLRDAAAATKFADETLPKLATAFRLPKTGPDGQGSYLVAKKPLAITTKGTEVWLAWGNQTPHDMRPVQPEIATSAAAQRIVLFWPGRLPSVDVASAAPVMWTGRNAGTQTLDEIRWPGLGSVVRTVVNRLTLDLPPDIAETAARKPK